MALPWRSQPRSQVPGLPAWSAPTQSTPLQDFDITPIGGITPDWAWGGADGHGVRACVVDSGVDGGHPLIGELDRAVTVTAAPDGELSIADVEPTDTAGHGTACAGVIRSIAPAVALSSVRVLTDGIHGSGAALLAGLRWAVEEGFDVINLSLSTTKPQFYQALHELADRAYFRRCTLVVSAHNMPVLSYPWTFASVISVASHDETDPMAYYYNPAPPVEFYARGLKVDVAWRGGGKMRVTGNSFASPHIAGISSLILSKHPWLTPFQLKSVLFLASRNVTSPQEGAHVLQ
jgi:subtilisin family serine protease